MAEPQYERLTPLATGGMAELLLAQRRGTPGFRKLVVLKRVLPAHVADPSFSRMFLREARIAASLDHPNVVQVYDSGTLEGRTFLAMEYVHGVDLRAIVARLRDQGRGLPLPHLLTIAVGVCAALAYVHHRRNPKGEPMGLVHRDLSPSNVLVSYEGAVKLADFGVAAASAKSIATRTGSIKGKLAYMAPEQARGEPVDGRADLYGLGTVLYELSTGFRAFAAANDAALLYRVLEAEPIPPREHVPDYPPDLEALVLRVMAKDPAERPADAAQLQLQLEDLATSRGVPISPARLGAYVRELCGEQPTPTLRGEVTEVAGPEDAPTRVELHSIESSVTRRRPRRSLLWVGAAAVGLTVGVVATWGAVGGRADASAATPAPETSRADEVTERAELAESPSGSAKSPASPAGAAEASQTSPAAEGEGAADDGTEPQSEEETAPEPAPRKTSRKPRRSKRRSTKSKPKPTEPGLDSPLPFGS